MPTVRDVAEAAGVSTASVSRALNAPDSVSAEVRNRVSREVAALGYVRNGAGRALASQRSGVVGVVLPSLAGDLHDRVLAALEEALRPSGHVVALGVAGAEDPVECASRLFALGAEGIVSIGNGDTGRLRSVADRRGTPCIEVVAERVHAAPDTIGLDFRRAGLTVAQYLYGLGHRRFALLAGAGSAHALDRARAESLQAALAALPAVSVIETTTRTETFDAAIEATCRLLQRPSPPTAIVCTDDVLAAGAARGCEQSDVAIPAEVSIAGFGDSEWTRHLRPALTSVRLPVAASGRAAAEWLLERLANRTTGSGPALVARLIVRGSSGPAPHR